MLNGDIERVKKRLAQLTEQELEAQIDGKTAASALVSAECKAKDPVKLEIACLLWKASAKPPELRQFLERVVSFLFQRSVL